MKYTKLINFKAISEELTGSKTKITQSRPADKYSQILSNLDGFIDLWLKQSREILEPKQKNKNKARNNSFK